MEGVRWSIDHASGDIADTESVPAGMLPTADGRTSRRSVSRASADIDVEMQLA